MNQQTLEKYLWGAAVYLRGHIDAGDYKQFIFPLLFFKRICDVYVSAITQSAPPDNHFSDFKVHHFRMENRSLPGTANVLGLGTCPISSKCPNNSPFNP